MKTVHCHVNVCRVLALSGALVLAAQLSGEEAAKPTASKPAAETKPALPVVEDFETRSFVLRYAKAEEVADSLNALCKKLGVREAAVAFPDSHAVAVAAASNVVAACAKIVGDIDRKPKQVYVEARFLDLTASDIQALGIGWNFLNDLTIGGTASVTYNGTQDSAGKYTDSTTFTGKLTSGQLELVLAALRVNNDNRLLANPRVVVGSGKVATVDISTKRPNVIVSAKRTTGNDRDDLDVDVKLQEVPGKDKLMFAGESFFWWGIGLTVEPYVAEDGIITARIVPNISALSDISQQAEGPYVMTSTGNADMPSSRFPIIDVKRIETEFSLKSGETAVIGGLSKTEFQEIETGIPYLWKIPIIGPYVFGYTKTVRRQREIVVLVTMGLVDPETPDKAAGLPKNAVISREYINGNKKEPGDRTYDELKRMYRQDEKPNADDGV